MKTLADLKRNAQSYTWQLISNSWYKSVPEFQSCPRKVGQIQSNSFTLLTDKEGKGEYTESWLDFPKASELKIDHQGDLVLVTITRKLKAKLGDPVLPADHVMQYVLKSI